MSQIIAYIDDHKQEFGVEPICRVLSEHGVQVAPSTCYDASNRGQSSREQRDQELAVEISRVHAVVGVQPQASG